MASRFLRFLVSCQQVDKPTAALIKNLKQRSLLETIDNWPDRFALRVPPMTEYEKCQFFSRYCVSPCGSSHLEKIAMLAKDPNTGLDPDCLQD